jgi:hypothetical protein
MEAKYCGVSAGIRPLKSMIWLRVAPATIPPANVPEADEGSVTTIREKVPVWAQMFVDINKQAKGAKIAASKSNLFISSFPPRI